MEIIHIYSDLSKIGGAQAMVIKLYQGMKREGITTKIASYTSYHKIHPNYKKLIIEREYIVLDKLSIFNFNKRSILISHHRKVTTTLLLIYRGLFKNLKLIHVAHNEFSNLKWITFYPERIIAVSFKVKKNLINYFKIADDRIKVIHNGIEDANNDIQIDFSIKKNINILYPARITSVKQQLELVKLIKEKDIKGINITFCGDGEKYIELVKLIKGDSRFTAKGLVTDMKREYINTDFVLLFSKKEGLPVSLIESCKYGLPIICNDVGGNTEIVENGINGFVVNNYSDLGKLLDSLNKITLEEYTQLSKNSRKVFVSKFKEELMLNNYFEQINGINKTK